MDNLNDEFFVKTPKQFCENMKFGFNKEAFLMAVASGERAELFVLTPEHTKRLLQHLQHTVHNYEKAHGEIKAEWTPNMLSPIQMQFPKEDKPAE